MKDFVAALFTDASPEERAKTARLVFRVIVVAALIWGWGGFTDLGLPGFARADSIDKKIDAAITPVRSDLERIAEQLHIQEDTLKQIRIDQLATKLRELKRVCCLAGSDHEARERLEREIERSQREYRDLTGERYPLPACREPSP